VRIRACGLLEQQRNLLGQEYPPLVYENNGLADARAPKSLSYKGL